MTGKSIRHRTTLGLNALVVIFGLWFLYPGFGFEPSEGLYLIVVYGLTFLALLMPRAAFAARRFPTQ